ncbi:MAG: hypothetical protein ISN64_02725 [Rickettsia sp.]|nr:hypothetical protein [Rickettsia sp.]
MNKNHDLLNIEKKLYSEDEKALITKLSNQMKNFHRADIEFLVLHLKKFLLTSLYQNKKIEVRKFGVFSTRVRKFPLKNEKYRFLHFKMSSKIFT